MSSSLSRYRKELEKQFLQRLEEKPTWGRAMVKDIFKDAVVTANEILIDELTAAAEVDSNLPSNFDPAVREETVYLIANSIEAGMDCRFIDGPYADVSEASDQAEELGGYLFRVDPGDNSTAELIQESKP